MQSQPRGFSQFRQAEPRRFLIVGAPYGRFSFDLARRLRRDGAEVTRVLTHGGEVWDWGLDHAVTFRRRQSKFPQWILAQLKIQETTDLLTFGDSHFHARAAIRQAKRLGLRVHVLEEGYFRPHWITVEQDGVNGASRLPRDPSFYRTASQFLSEDVSAPVGRLLPGSVANIVTSHAWMYLLRPLFPHYRTPFAYSPIRQAASHALRYVENLFRQRRDHAQSLRALETPGPIFVVLLQRPGDSQLTRHCAFASVSDFTRHVIENFAKNAPADARLLFKGHPLDHGIENHGASIAEHAKASGVANRVTFVRNGHLATFVRAARGVVCINSTAGLTAVEFGAPTITLGNAIYDIPGMTHQSGLDAFWTAPERPDPDLYRAFRRVVMAQTQVNGGFSTQYSIDLAIGALAKRLLAADAQLLDIRRPRGWLRNVDVAAYVVE